jgi:eukaryotic-like serine/threonine-protein kinase
MPSSDCYGLRSPDDERVTGSLGLRSESVATCPGGGANASALPPMPIYFNRLSLTPGTRLGPYEILSALGAGGMGEVYKARDQRLNRTVAIKVLPSPLANDRQASERFEFEARAVAALNHPHICTLHDVGREGGIAFLVMEYLDGETLADRLERGPLTLDQALECAIQIASALDRVHRAGLVHRDLKPGNIMLTKAAPGSTSPLQVKVLDFGISKAPASVATPDGETTRIDVKLTSAGMVLGTVRYMAPEQLAGKPADARSDIFAFGGVLYEMIVGTPAFYAPTNTALIAAIRDQEPQASARLTPALTRVIRTCLAKDSDDRWQTARDLLRELQWIQEGKREALANEPARSWWMTAIAAGVAAIAVAAGLWFIASTRPAPRAAVAARFEISTPSTTDPMSFALSADGRLLTFVATKDGVAKLWLRPLNQVNAQPLDGTDGASFPFWAPDGHAIGFFASGKLRRIDVGGGPTQELADAPNGRGGSWSPGGIILFAPSTAGPLARVPAAGGAPQPAIPLGAGQNSHRWPQFLPDGKRFVFLSTQGQPGTGGVFIASLDGGAPTRVLDDDAPAVFVAPDRLLLVRQGALTAVALDLDGLALTGEPVVVARPVGFDTQLGRGAFTVSESGVLAYRSAIAARRQLVWVDRDGRYGGTVGPADDDALAAPELSHDGRRVAVFRSVDGNADVWSIPIGGGVPSRLTFTPNMDGFPIWSQDGQRLIFTGMRDAYHLLERLPSGEERSLFTKSELRIANDISPDGRFLLYSAQIPASGVDLWTVPLASSSEAAPSAIAQMPFDEMAGQFSPDGGWIAHQANATGRLEVYVRPFPGSGSAQQVSLGGGSQPRWSRDGSELFYVAADGRLMVVPIAIDRAAHTIEASAPHPLFQTQLATGANIPPAVASKAQYVVAPDGRFLMNVAVEGAPAPPISVSLDWHAGVE